MKNKNIEDNKQTISVDTYSAYAYSNELALIIEDLEHLSDQVNKTLKRIASTMQEVRDYKEKFDNNLI